MTAEAPAQPVIIEAGRYRIGEDGAGGWLIARAVATCDKCQGCGCGEQAEVIKVPAFVLAMARSQGAGFMAKAKALMGRGVTVPDLEAGDAGE